MILCHCAGINDVTVRALAGLATSIAELGDICGAGVDCGGCHPLLAEILVQHHGVSAGAAVALGVARESVAPGATHAAVA